MKEFGNGQDNEPSILYLPENMNKYMEFLKEIHDFKIYRIRWEVVNKELLK